MNFLPLCKDRCLSLSLGDTLYWGLLGDYIKMTADQLKQREEVMRNIIVQLMGHTEYMHIIPYQNDCGPPQTEEEAMRNIN